ncbi:MAG: methyltransferase domain-containing protein [Armatimonadetes bacterium]|nr:methyltransferase domain-containing protein [Armatimonadota bacterium]
MKWRAFMQPWQMLDGVFQRVSGPAFCVEYANHEQKQYGEGEPLFTLVLHDPRLSDFFTDDITLAFGEAYMDGRIDVRGDLADVVSLAIRNASLADGPSNLLRTAVSKTAGFARRSLQRQHEDVTHHYDLGNAFFSLWLDESMTYSCAYFRNPADTLEQAQITKLDHSLKKLRLKPGEALLDIGCGWGSAVLRAASRFNVRATGITLSEEQCRYGEESIQKAGLEGRARIRREHYATLDEGDESFDKVISIGMMEHVGKPHLAEFASVVKRLLKPGGLALLHLITCRFTGPVNSWTDKYIFPGGYLPTLPEIAGCLNDADFRIWDIENLGPHYRRTLDCWSERYERCVHQVRGMYDERFVRMWRMFLRGCSAAFREGNLDVHQLLVSKGDPNDLPLTREDLYAE